MIVALFATMGTLVAQEKYAIIIGGNMNPGTTIPATEQWNGGNNPGQYGFDEIWNDAYLTWEMLVTEVKPFGKGYINENIHVLLGGNGEDFSFPGQDPRYKAITNGYTKLTDAASTESNIQSTFTSMATTITADDFLFVWIMGHGGSDATGHYFYSYDNQKIYDYVLAGWLNGIAAHKKTVFLSFPKSGGFAPVLEADGNIVITACGATEGASRADDMAPSGAFTENEVRSNITYNHGEINYHLFSSLTGKTPKGEDQYAGTDLDLADLNSDNYIAINETWVWTSDKETLNGESPVCSDLGNIKSFTELEYPTLLWQGVSTGNTVTYRGLIGISKSFGVADGAGLRFDNASNINCLRPYNGVFASPGSTIDIGNNVTISSENSVFQIMLVSENLSIGSNLRLEGKQYGDLIFNCQSPDINLTIENLESINGNMAFTLGTVSIINAELKNSTMQLSANLSSCRDSHFSNSLLTTYDFFNTENIRIESCTFINESNDGADYEYVGINIQGCNSFNIENCSINGYTD